MIFTYSMPTKVYFGDESLEKNKNIISKFGKRALLVTGMSSAKACGALDEITKILSELNIEYKIFDKVENNPSLENVKKGGDFAKEIGADFVIGIGGGSPLDASKAIAVLATNKIEPIELFNNKFENLPLPIIAFPTTSGTGSEVTPYSILTRKDLSTKMSFGNDDTFPKVAFVLPKYTYKLGFDIIVNTALDAFSHSMEGYLSRRSTLVSDVFAVESMKYFGEVFEKLCNNELDNMAMEKLSYASVLGGIVISHTATTVIHGMGYSLTYFKDIPHGRANAIFIEEYLKFVYQSNVEKVENVLKLLNMKSIEIFGDAIKKIISLNLSISQTEVEEFSRLTMIQRSTQNTCREVTQEDVRGIISRSIGKI